MKLLVVAGHGAGDSGAVGNGYTEAERVRALAKRIKELGGSSVTLGDTSVNWYASNKFSTISANAYDAAIELHLDSATASAKGGHVIIYSGFSADSYDNKLASFIGSFFPGRSSKIVGRSDLLNVNVCANRGINYRLLECCFISNSEDMKKFNAKIDEIAKGILASFGIGAGSSSSSGSAAGSSSSKKSIDELAKEVINGKWGNGSARKAALQKAGYDYDAVQKRVNEMLGSGSTSASVDIDALAKAVIRGDYGNGEARKKALGSNYDAVQKRVNEMLG